MPDTGRKVAHCGNLDTYFGNKAIKEHFLKGFKDCFDDGVVRKKALEVNSGNEDLQSIVSEEQVKKALQIDSFRNLSKDKIMEFASLIPHMDKDVAIAIINQFPAYIESSHNMIEQYNAMCDKVLQSNDDSRKDAVMAYKTILDNLSILLKQDGITPEQQEKITDKMILVADKIADLHEDNRNFLEESLSMEHH